MKKTLLLALLLLCYLTGFAQLEGPTAIRQNHNLFSGLDAPNGGIGIKGGVSFANAYGSDKDKWGDASGLTTFHAGIYAQFSFGEFFSLQPELLYSRKGFERNDSTFRFDYLEVPLLAVFSITNNFSVHLGPQAGIMVAANQGEKEVALEPYNTFDYGFAAGLEGYIGHFRLGTRYSMGLADLRKLDKGGNSLNEDVKNGVIQVYLGIGF
ncbi:outer membrane protein with beta-barrel domain [Pontibacter ummariensis]|uniref:Outer membrane protein beta-barrel domain-containing protein n=1 Tax=Pontibacter ummariensis TaxID=1610492 RepID=A0A239L315_9BACT|nr:porin family protein [Pontibacter ummariensis]PRY04625.1 outer membrane protein with beta-barrel domain [Pontibacter ummariensis]SNT23934.1 Outer membrane protein beta-barrel domain-containing protein [Pontibacter ummariensis]